MIIELVNLDEFEKNVEWHDMSEEIQRVNDRIADDRRERARRESRDFARLRNQIVGNENRNG